ncbi:peptidyl-prolyl cis-trans isomerase B (cyclophilin B) [Amycolatopsis bartoniae]|uniref:Peptidylprolyl isomerase n=1 Tax=Amycolatopsis bartoniae TaxID=941986 RepID=A0A8H9MBU3_9PSEU|nr:peptidylprolyl isomerase [Amycolatopsis bartoniae]MBB2936644.1 peptidyl-prolyl cis-trans isomerase B (cyclophilin B) [Amycolatopsis bartoniae]TVT09772.1 peptidylprolyl isomerase [Amycolatopsis bartoniae]GHF67445.1 peptidylprolyl isomerase [Amycolatopsis bartoniae]
MATNQQRREAAKRKLERQLVRRAERARRRKIIGVGATVGVVVVVAGLVVFFVTQGGGSDSTTAADQTSAPESSAIQIPTQRVTEAARPTPLPNPTTCNYPASTDQQSTKKATPPDGKNVPSTGTVNVTLKTTAGDIPLTLDRALAPCTVNSFLSLINQGFYTDSSCHRLGTEGLQMLQCGDPTGTGMGGPGYTIPDENFAQLTYGRGVLAMAKTSQPNSGGSQFFMVYGDAQLDPDYTVFGSISDAGLQVLDKVARDGVDPASAAQSQDGTGAPKTPVKFTGATVDA